MGHKLLQCSDCQFAVLLWCRLHMLSAAACRMSLAAQLSLSMVLPICSLHALHCQQRQSVLVVKRSQKLKLAVSVLVVAEKVATGECCQIMLVAAWVGPT